MSEATPRIPVARSAALLGGPTTIVAGWEVSASRTDAALRLADLSPLTKLVVRAGEDGPFADWIGVAHLGARRDDRDVLVVGSGPGEWTLIGPVGSASQLRAQLSGASAGERCTLIDLTHGRSLLRLTGSKSSQILSALCAIDLHDRSFPNGSSCRSSVAKVVTDVIRDDRGSLPSYLLHCERASGGYLAAQLRNVGASEGLEIEGFDQAIGHEPRGKETPG